MASFKSTNTLIILITALRYLDRLHVLDRFMHLEYSRCPKIDTDDHCKVCLPNVYM